MQRLELAQLLRVGPVRRLAVRDGERRLPRARPDAEGGLEPGVAPLAEHRATGEALLGDALPAKADLVGRAERLEANEAGDLGREADRGKLPPVSAQLVDAERRHHLLDALAERFDEVRERVRVAGRDGVLQQQVRVDRIGAEGEGDHHVVEVAQAPGRYDERAVAPESGLRDERAMRGGDDEQRIEPGAALGDDGIVSDDDEPRARAHPADRLGAKTGQRVARMVLPVAIGLEHDRRSPLVVARETSENVFDEPRPPLARERAEVVGRETGGRGVAAKEDRRRELEPRSPRAPPRQRPRSEKDARRKVLDLALAVDRGVGDDRHRLVQVVREIRARSQRRERSVVAERADRLIPGLRHGRGLLQIVGLEAERGELPLTTHRHVLDLVRRDADLPAAHGGDRLGRPATAEPLPKARGGHAMRRARADEPLAHLALVEEAPAALVAAERNPLAGTERHRIGHVALERYEATLACEDVLFVGLHVPQWPKAERIDAEDAGVPNPREDRGRTLRKWAERGARLDVRVLQLGAHALHLVDDRREEELDGLDGREPMTDHQTADDRIDVLRVAPVTRERKAERAGLFAEPADRVDLTVVSEDRKRLDPGEARRGIRRVAVVAESDRGGEAVIREVREIGRKLGPDAPQLVHDRVPRERDHGRVGRALYLDGRLVQRSRPGSPASRELERELDEARRLDTTARAERRLVGRLGAREQDADPVGREDRPELGELALSEEDVPDREAPAVDGRRILSRAREEIRPERARDVGEHSSAVALAVDGARAMREARHPVEDEVEDFAGRPRVLARDGHESARVVLARHGSSHLQQSLPFDPGGFRRAVCSRSRLGLVLRRCCARGRDATAHRIEEASEGNVGEQLRFRARSVPKPYAATSTSTGSPTRTGPSTATTVQSAPRRCSSEVRKASTSARPVIPPMRVQASASPFP